MILVNNNFVRHFDARTSPSSPTQLKFVNTSLSIDFGYDCHSVLKHVLKSYDIFLDVHNSRKRVVGLIYKTHTHSSWHRLKWVGFIFCMGTYPVATHKMAPECCEMLTFLDSSRQFSRCAVEKHNFCLICEQIIEFGIWEENYGMPKPMRICRNEFS